MPQQRLLAINDACLTAYAWRSGQLSRERNFGADAEGRVQWDEYVRANRQAVFSVFAALAEEGLQTEDIPHATGADRRALIERKLSQRYPGTTWTFARSLGRNKSGRRDEKILMAALSHPELIAPWLAPLQRAEARLAGIYTTPFLAEPLAAELEVAEASFLLVALLNGGLQQMFFDHGRLRFSRVIAADTADLQSAGEICADQSAKLRDYLVGQRLLGSDSTLPLIALLHPRDASAFRCGYREHGPVRLSFSDLLAVSRKHGLRSLPEDSRSDVLFLHLMVRRTTGAQYAPPGLRRFYHLGRIQSILTAAAATLVFAALASTARDLAEHRSLDHQQAGLSARIASANSAYQSALDGMPTKQFAAGALRSVIERLEAVRREESRLPNTLAAISAALERTRGVELERLDWGQENEQASEALGQRIDIHAALPQLPGEDAAAQEQAVNGFATTLRHATGLAVETLQWPAAVDLKRALAHGDLERIAAERPRFVLRLAAEARR